ncbi:ATP-binding protein, partial [Burkholderia gladioli]|uniref:ATP-binding protein n=1 Tax=Burkholderia gladioli TaxID=28095 RepID=UPI0034DB0D54
THCTSSPSLPHTRASGPAARESLATWLDTFGRHWRLRHPHVEFEQIGAGPAGLELEDTVAVGQILTILLDNAARASRDRVTLQARLARQGERDTIVFEVVDNGPGIPPALRESLGTAPVDSTQGGHGVGLYLAFSAASRLGGTIELADAAPRGTRALLRLPVTRQAASADPSAGLIA